MLADDGAIPCCRLIAARDAGGYIEEVRRGFTLAEIVVATGLIALCLFFLVSLVPTANLSLRKAEDTESATLYAQQQIETVRRTLAKAPPTATTAVQLNGTDFKVETDVVRLSSQGSYGLDEITVTLTRADGRGAPVRLVSRALVRTL